MRVGSAPLDQLYSTVPSGRAVAEDTVPGGTGSTSDLAVEGDPVQRRAAAGLGVHEQRGRRRRTSPGPGRPRAPTGPGAPPRRCAGRRRTAAAGPRARAPPAAGRRPRPGLKPTADSPRPSPSQRSQTTSPSSVSTRSARCRESPCSECSSTTSDSSLDSPVTSASCSLRYSTEACPSRSTCTTVPSSSEPPTTTTSRPISSPAGYASGTPGVASSSGPPAHGWRTQRPNSSPSVSRNHQTLSPSGGSVPSLVPFGRSVTWRTVAGVAVPGVQLEGAGRVGDVQAAVRGVARPVRQRDAGGAEALLPQRQVGHRASLPEPGPDAAKGTGASADALLGTAEAPRSLSRGDRI